MNIGLIAGRGSFPRLLLHAARQAGHEVAIVAIEGEALADFEAFSRSQGVTAFSWMPLGALNACIATLKSAGVTQAVMAGHVKHTHIFGGLTPDPMLAQVLSRLPAKNADALLSAVVMVLEQHGITVMDSIALLPELVARAGVLTRRAPSDDARADFEFGCRIADTIAGLDIGQTVIVKDRAVVAVEGMEGTDVAIARAGQLAGPGTRVVKVAKPAQDLRFDVPVVGIGTVEAMQKAGADALTIDAGLTLILDGDRFIEAADRAGLAVVGRPRA